MVMSSPCESSSPSPISRVPYDVLLEIFIQCLPKYPLHNRLLPKIAIAPMLLCRICSSWRTAALTSTILWTHLYMCLTVVHVSDTSTSPRSWTIGFGERGIKFMQWWKNHQGSVPPFLRLNVYRPRCLRNISQDLAPPDSMAFLLEYIASAQYLELDKFYWGLIEKKLKAGNQIIFPSLHTLLVDHAWVSCYAFYRAQSLIPNHAPSALRRLSISEDRPPDDFAIPNRWSALTHLSLHASLSLRFWFSLIRAVPNLQWGHFDITLMSSSGYIVHPQCALLQLTTLFVSYGSNDNSTLASHLGFPLGLLFTDLHLPVLHTLWLSSPGTSSWEDHYAIIGLYGILKSTPAIAKLALADNFVSFHTRHAAMVFTEIEGVEPLWTQVTELVHLQLNLPSTKSISEAAPAERLYVFVDNIFSSDSVWLDLRNPGCPIRSLTLSDHGSSDRVRDFAMSSVRKNIEKAPNVVFQHTSDSAEQVAADMHDGWGSRF